MPWREEYRKAVCGKPHARFDEGGLPKLTNGPASEAPRIAKAAVTDMLALPVNQGCSLLYPLAAMIAASQA